MDGEAFQWLMTFTDGERRRRCGLERLESYFASVLFQSRQQRCVHLRPPRSGYTVSSSRMGFHKQISCLVFYAVASPPSGEYVSAGYSSFPTSATPRSASRSFPFLWLLANDISSASASFRYIQPPFRTAPHVRPSCSMTLYAIFHSHAPYRVKPLGLLLPTNRYVMHSSILRMCLSDLPHHLSVSNVRLCLALRHSTCLSGRYISRVSLPF